MPDPRAAHLRCRVGFHKWVRIKVVEPTPEQEPWETRCRYCRKKRWVPLKEGAVGGGGA